MTRKPEVVLGVVGAMMLALGVGAATSGLSTQQARTAAPSTLTASGTNTEGTSLAFARADHTHATSYLATLLGAVSRTFASKFGDTVSVKDFGVVGSGSDESTGFQAAIAAQQVTKGRLYIPCGTYVVNSALSLSSTAFGVRIEGENMSCVTIKAGAAMTAVFQFADTTANGSFEFRELTIDGNQLAAKGISSTQIRYMNIDRLIIKNTTTAAVDVAEGWDQNITASQFINNSGDGLRLGTNANNVHVQGNVIASNPGWGITVQTGLGIDIYNNDISGNETGGIYIVSGSGTAGAGTVNIKDNYFEGNAAHATTATLTSGSANVTASTAAVAIAASNVGHAFVGPSIPASTTIVSASGTTIVLSANATASATETDYITVGTTITAVTIKADILLNGSATQTTLDTSFPISNVNIEGCSTSSYGATVFTAYVNSPAVKSLRLVGNTHTVYSKVSQLPFSSLLNSGGLAALVVQGNQGFTGFNNAGLHFHDRAAIITATNVVIDLALGEEFVVAEPTNGAFTINAPANNFWTTSRPQYQYITIRVRNSLGAGAALGAITWGTGYKMAAWTNPLDGFSRSITFSWDSFSNAWVEVSRTPADVPN